MQTELRRFPTDLWYDRNHYWLRVDGHQAVVGLTDYGLSLIGEIAYLELPPAGTSIRQGEGLGSVESGKWVGKLTAPVSGTILETNSALEAEPDLIKRDPYTRGWMFKVRIDKLEELNCLMDQAAYVGWIDQQACCQRGQG